MHCVQRRNSSLRRAIAIDARSVYHGGRWIAHELSQQCGCSASSQRAAPAPAKRRPAEVARWWTSPHPTLRRRAFARRRHARSRTQTAARHRTAAGASCPAARATMRSSAAEPGPTAAASIRALQRPARTWGAGSCRTAAVTRWIAEPARPAVLGRAYRAPRSRAPSAASEPAPRAVHGMCARTRANASRERRFRARTTAATRSAPARAPGSLAPWTASW